MNPFAFYGGVVAPVGAVLLINALMYCFTIVQLVRYTILKARLASARQRARERSASGGANRAKSSRNRSSKAYAGGSRSEEPKLSDRERSDSSLDTYEPSIARTLSSPSSSNSGGVCSSSTSAASLSSPSLSPDASRLEATAMDAMQARRGARIRALFGSLARHRPRRSRSTASPATCPNAMTTASQSRYETAPISLSPRTAVEAHAIATSASVPSRDALENVFEEEPYEQSAAAVADLRSDEHCQQEANNTSLVTHQNPCGSQPPSNNAESLSHDDENNADQKVTVAKCTSLRHSSSSTERWSLLEILLPRPPLPPTDDEEEEEDEDEDDVPAPTTRVDEGKGESETQANQNEAQTQIQSQNANEAADTENRAQVVAEQQTEAAPLSAFSNIDATNAVERSCSQLDSGVSSSAPSSRRGSGQSGSSTNQRSSLSASGGLEQRNPPAVADAAAAEVGDTCSRTRYQRKPVVAAASSRARRAQAVEPSVYVMVALHVKTALGLLVALGLTWLFAVFIVGAAAPVLTYLFTIFNSLTGLFVLLLYGVFKRDVKLALCKRCRRARDHQKQGAGRVGVTRRAMSRTEAVATGRLPSPPPPAAAANDCNSGCLERKSSFGTTSLNSAHQDTRQNQYIARNTDCRSVQERSNRQELKADTARESESPQAAAQSSNDQKRPAAAPVIKDMIAKNIQAIKDIQPKKCRYDRISKTSEANMKSDSRPQPPDRCIFVESIDIGTESRCSSATTSRERTPTPPVRTPSPADGQLTPLDRSESERIMERSSVSPVRRTPSSASSVCARSASSSARTESPRASGGAQKSPAFKRSFSFSQLSPQPETAETEAPSRGDKLSDIKCSTDAALPHESDHNIYQQEYERKHHSHHHHHHRRHHQDTYHQADHERSPRFRSFSQHDSSRELNSARIWVDVQKT